MAGWLSMSPILRPFFSRLPGSEGQIREVAHWNNAAAPTWMLPVPTGSSEDVGLRKSSGSDGSASPISLACLLRRA